MSEYRKRANRMIAFLKMLEDSGFVSCHKRILTICYLLERSDDNGVFSITYEQIAEDLDIERTTVSNTFKSLFNSGLLRMLRTNRNANNVPEYQFNNQQMKVYVG